MASAVAEMKTVAENPRVSVHGNESSPHSSITKREQPATQSNKEQGKERELPSKEFVNHQPWWMNFNLTQDPYNAAQKREIISNFHINSILSVINRSLAANPPPEKVRVLLAGVSGAGKSSLLVTIMSALKETGAIEYFRAKIGVNDSTVRIPVQRESTSTFIELGLRNGVRCMLELVDSRGSVNTDHNSEFVGLANGYLPTNQQIRREGDKAVVQRFVSAEPHLKERFQCVLVVVPADLDIAKDASLYIELRQRLEESRLPYVHVFTKVDFECADKTIPAIKSKLNLHSHDVLLISCYNAKNDSLNEKTNSEALSIILWSLILCETRGLTVRKRPLREVLVEMSWVWVSEALGKVHRIVSANGYAVVAVVVLAILLLYFLRLIGF